MRVGRASGRGERARVARRVRAMLADADESADGAARAGRGDTPEVLPWLPADDLTSAMPAVSPSPPPPEPSTEPDPPRAVGWIGRLTARLSVRLDPGWRGAVVIGVAVLVAAVLTGGWVLSARPRSVAVTDSSADPTAVASVRSEVATAGSLSPTATAVSAAPSSAAALLVVDVAGKVHHPGLYRLPVGARVDDALHAAGGALPGVDLSTVNLAAKLTDGQQISVGMPGAVPAPAVPGSGSAAVMPPVDLNSATLDQLETLPGVGPVLGQHIIDWRIAHGRFATVDQLRDVSGIGDVKFAALRSRVTV